MRRKNGLVHETKARVAESLSDLPHEILSCTDTSCSVHHKMLDTYAEHFISTLLYCALQCFPCCTRSSRKVVGWNDTTNAFKKDANFWHRFWEEAGCPKAGVLFNIKRCVKRRFKYEVRRIKRRRQQLLRDKLAFSFARKRKDKFWSDIKRLNRSGDSLLAPVVDGSGGRNIASTFASKFTSLLNKHSMSSRSSLLASVQSSITVSQLSTVDFSVDDVIEALSQLKNNTHAEIFLYYNYYYNEGTKVHNPRRYILFVYCHIILYVYSVRINCMRYVYGMRESTGKYTEVWQRLSSESLRVALAYCLR